MNTNSQTSIRINPVLVLMARWPGAGRCKKRLAADIGSLRAASIQEKLTNHTLEVAKRMEKKGLVELRIAITGVASRSGTQWKIKNGIKTLDFQGEGTLGLRMRRQILRVQKRYGNRTTILIGADLPTLCERDLIHALDALKNHEFVLGPAKDGGYWLIALSGGLLSPVISWPFTGIPWGGNQVLTETLLRAKIAGVNHYLLEQKNDLDQLSDLSPWIS